MTFKGILAASADNMRASLNILGGKSILKMQKFVRNKQNTTNFRSWFCAIFEQVFALRECRDLQRRHGSLCDPWRSGGSQEEKNSYKNYVKLQIDRNKQENIFNIF